MGRTNWCSLLMHCSSLLMATLERQAACWHTIERLAETSNTVGGAYITAYCSRGKHITKEHSKGNERRFGRCSSQLPHTSKQSEAFACMLYWLQESAWVQLLCGASSYMSQIHCACVLSACSNTRCIVFLLRPSSPFGASCFRVR